LRNALREGDAVPTSGQLDSLASKLGPLFGAAVGGAAVGIAASSATASGVASGGAGVGLGAKVVASIALAGAIAGGGVWLAHRAAGDESPAKAVPAVATPPAAAAPGALRPQAAREEQREARAPAATPGAPAPSRAAAPNEAALLDTAQSVLATNPERALALTRAHRQRFPNGVLAQEREVIAIEALSRLGRKDDAKQRSEEFERTYPGSAHQRKVESAVEP
jgi:hypothetical protein